jgi:hypothetical protein
METQNVLIHRPRMLKDHDVDGFETDIYTRSEKISLCRGPATACFKFNFGP